MAVSGHPSFQNRMSHRLHRGTRIGIQLVNRVIAHTTIFPNPDLIRAIREDPGLILTGGWATEGHPYIFRFLACAYLLIARELSWFQTNNYSLSIQRGIFMIKGSDKRKADHPIDNLFLERWSPRSMTGQPITHEELLVLFEAARWAPSSFNNQPWRIPYAHRETDQWPKFFGLLVEGNQLWAKNAAALLVFISKTTFDYNGKPSITHIFDTGAAWENLALQGWLKGFVVHGMQGFDYERARTELNIPEEFRVEAMVAIGYPVAAEELPEKLAKVETPSDRRKLDQTICEGPFCFQEDLRSAQYGKSCRED